MSFATPFASRVISPIADAAWELLDRVPTESESGWDTMRDTWLVRLDTVGDDPAALLVNATFQDTFGRGLQIPGKTMWIVNRAPRVLARGLFEVQITSMGLLSPRGYKVTYDAGASIQSPQNPVTISGTTHAKTRVREGTVTANFEYVATSTVAPTHADFLTKHTSRAQSPPAGWAPTVPASVWASLSDPTYNYPNGWVFEGAGMENIPGLLNVWLIREKYAYIQAYEP